MLAGATLLALAAWLVATGSARADVTSLGISSEIVDLGGEVVLNVTAQATDPGIGAYTVDVVYDGALVSALACTSVGPCNTEPMEMNTVRLTGTSAQGLTGEVILGSITFEAGTDEGTAALVVTVVTLAGPDTVDISVTPTDGTIWIVAPHEVIMVEPTAEPTPGGLPPTGGAPVNGAGSSAWLLASVIGLGLAALGTGAWAVARRQR